MNVRGALALTLLLLGTAVAPAQLMIDTEPTNNTSAGADALPLPPTGGAVLVVPEFEEENDIDFYKVPLTAGQVVFGMLTGLQDLPNTFDIPNTMVSTLKGDTRLTANDDDEAEELLGDTTISFGLGSLFRLQADEDTEYQIAATGFDDADFNGSGNSQHGYYALTVGKLASLEKGGDFLDTDPTNDVMSGADLISIANNEAKVAVGTLEPRPLDQPADVDFFSLGTLTAGRVVNVMTAPLTGLASNSPNFDNPDTSIALFNSGGGLVGNADAPFAEDRFAPLFSDNPVGANPTSTLFGSAFRAMISEDGEYFIGVTGDGDAAFEGNHFQEGEYALMISIVPEPSSSLLMLGGLGLLLAGRRRRA